VKLKIPAFSGWRGGGPAWTAVQVGRLGTELDKDTTQDEARGGLDSYVTRSESFSPRSTPW
jgi:hypothetical protein